MASFYVLTPPGSNNPEKDTLFVRDGFSWAAFLFPLPWLLFRRLWLIAGLAVILYLASFLAAERWGLDPLPLAFSLVLSLWVGLEGGHVRAYWLKRAGWTVKTILAAHNHDEAEAIYFAGEATSDLAPAPAPAWVLRPGGAVPLGLIGPYGGR